MGSQAGMTWPVPQPADIVWCYVPYVQPDGSVPLVRHPALVVAVNEKEGWVEVAVMGGTSYRKQDFAGIKRARRAWDLLLETADPWFRATGLTNDTLFHLERRYFLPYTPVHFFAPDGGTPKLGVLDGRHKELIERYRRASQAAEREQKRARKLIPK